MDFPYIWAEIDKKAISHNLTEIKRITNADTQIMAVVKANGYGHGIIQVAQIAVKNSATMLGVARINEAIELRKAEFDVPILILGYTHKACAKEIIKYNLIPTVYSYQMAKAISIAALTCGKKISVHVKIDTGMGRIGIIPDFMAPFSHHHLKTDNAINEVIKIACLKNLKIEGIFTHFSTADSRDKSFSNQQFEIFMDFLHQLSLAGLEIPVKHTANSAAIIDMPETHLDMVRAGICMYGLYPSNQVDKNRINLKPAMKLKTRIIHLKKVPAGFNISYGGTYKTPKPTTIATVPVGYSDGYSRMLSSRGYMIVREQKAPVVGRVCMDQTMLDVGHINGISTEDEVIIMGKQGRLSITADEIASLLNTISYEILSILSNRIKRIYI